jgi:hypothetical protein
MPSLITVPPATAAKSHETGPELLLIVPWHNARGHNARGVAASSNIGIEAENFFMVHSAVKFWAAQDPAMAWHVRRHTHHCGVLQHTKKPRTMKSENLETVHLYEHGTGQQLLHGNKYPGLQK